MRSVEEYFNLKGKDPSKVLRLRRKILEEMYASPDGLFSVREHCKNDILFYVNMFVYTYDPRLKRRPVIPMVTYPYQDEALLELVEAVGSNDELIEKSRDMGATWLCLIAIDWHFLFHEMQTFLCVSRKEEIVDKKGDPDCLFWKIDLMHKWLPKIMLPRITRNKLHFQNDDNGSTIDGSSTTGDVGRGGRRTAVFLDEFASVEDGTSVLKATRDMTTCRLFNSTPKGTNNAFYDMVKTNVKKLRFHWTQHPVKARGLYRSEHGRPVIVDKDYKFPDGYQFITDGKWRSPWYDLQCERAAHPMEIAQELDIDYLGSAFQFFDPKVIDTVMKEDVREPFDTGELVIDDQTVEPIEFESFRGGHLLLWLNVGLTSHVPSDHRYVIASDIGVGTGASNSATVVYDKTTREKVAEYAHANLKPHEYAKLMVGLARWFNGAFMIWEANGPGRIFGDTVLELGYRNIYYKENDKSVSRKRTDVPGWYSTKESKLSLLGEYRRALSGRMVTNRSQDAVKECLQFVFLPDNTVAHAESSHDLDPTGARDNHADRVIADALAWRVIKGGYSETHQEKKIPPYCLYARRMESLKRQREERRRW